jgi:hypothetical protein
MLRVPRWPGGGAGGLSLLALLLADLALDAAQHRGQAAQPQRADQVAQAELRTA